MDELLCACGGKLEFMYNMKGHSDDSPEVYQVAVYECPDCGGVFFYRRKDEGQ